MSLENPVDTPPLMRFEQHEHLLVVCHGKKNPTDAEWQSYLSHLSTQREHFGTLRTLTWSLGGGPTAVQRKSLNAVLGGLSTRAAMISAHPGIGFIVSALSLVNQELRLFNPSEIPDALLYLGLSTEESEVMLDTLDRLRARTA